MLFLKILLVTGNCIYVVVQLYPWLNFWFPLFMCMVINDNELKTKENKN